jgi:DNA-binding beta-propeller fold protein YncE
MRVGAGEHTYTWIEDWAKVPDGTSARNGWAHHGLAVTSDGRVVANHPDASTILVFDQEGNVVSSWDGGLTEAHGMVLVVDEDVDYLWIADQGAKRLAETGYQYSADPRGSKVVKKTLEGRTVASLPKPDLPIYRDARYAPTGVAVYEERHGGNGDIWVTDGYGQNQVHRFDQYGAYQCSLTGNAGEAGPFRTPHALWVDTRKPDPELYIADRGNRRVQVYDLEGTYKRVFGEDFLTSPSGFAVDGDHLIIGELRARVTIVDERDRLLYHLGANETVCAIDGWPNAKNSWGEPTRTPLVEPGKFNSPHGIATDSAGNIYVSEWLIGGRFIKLLKEAAAAG